jgi:hypothetical protein
MPRRMIRVRQLDGGVGECAAALGLILLEVTDMAQPCQELAFRIARDRGDLMREGLDARGMNREVRIEEVREAALPPRLRRAEIAEPHYSSPQIPFGRQVSPIASIMQSINELLGPGER